MFNFRLILLASLLLTSFVHGTTLPSLIKSTCSTTLYPQLCYTTLSTTTLSTNSTKKDLIQLTINKAKHIIQTNLKTISQILTTDATLTKRTKLALHDCLELGSETIRQIDTVIDELKTYPNKKPISQHANDLITLMSTTITNKETCLDGLSHETPSWLLRKLVIKKQDKGGKMCSNVLAMIKSMTDKDIVDQEEVNIKMFKDEENIVMWPEWLSAGDRKLLQSGTETVNVTVAADGSGDYTTVAAAVEAAPKKSGTRYVIKIKAGVYRENVNIPSGKTNLMFIGDGRSNTIITANESVAGGNTTFKSATVG